MSRVGKLPVALPSGVKAAVAEQLVHIEGPKGKLSYDLAGRAKVLVDGSKLVVSPTSKDPQGRAHYGSTRAHLNNMVLGVTKGWKKSLEMTGVGFNAKLEGKVLVLSVGFSHEVRLDIPVEIKCNIAKTTIDLESPNRDSIGLFAARIRKVQPPEPYLGKGIRYSDEKVRRKAGKTGKK